MLLDIYHIDISSLYALPPCAAACSLPLYRTQGKEIFSYRHNMDIFRWTDRLPSMLDYRMRGDTRTAAEAISSELPAIARVTRNTIQFPAMSKAYKSMMVRSFMISNGSSFVPQHDELKVLAASMDFDDGGYADATSTDVDMKDDVGISKELEVQSSRLEKPQF